MHIKKKKPSGGRCSVEHHYSDVDDGGGLWAVDLEVSEGSAGLELLGQFKGSVTRGLSRALLGWVSDGNATY